MLCQIPSQLLPLRTLGDESPGAEHRPSCWPRGTGTEGTAAQYNMLRDTHVASEPTSAAIKNVLK